MNKFWVFTSCLFLLSGCKDAPDSAQVSRADKGVVEVDALPEKAMISSGAREILQGWPEFLALESSMDALYRVGNAEELRLLLDELIEEQKRLADSEYPEPFDTPQIRSRQKVFHTYLLKTKAHLEYPQGPMEAAGELILAYNALCRQFTVMINSRLDTQLILDEDV